MTALQSDLRAYAELAVAALCVIAVVMVGLVVWEWKLKRLLRPRAPAPRRDAEHTVLGEYRRAVRVRR